MAKTELMKLFPALKQQFLKKIMNDSHDHSMPITEQLNLRGGQLVDSLWKEVKYPLLGIAVVVGLVLGLIEMALFFIVK